MFQAYRWHHENHTVKTIACMTYMYFMKVYMYEKKKYVISISSSKIMDRALKAIPFQNNYHG